MVGPAVAWAADPKTGEPKPGDAPPDVLTPRQWGQLDQRIDKALSWLASQQAEDGSFATYETARPGITALCTLAFLSYGHLPGEGRYGPVIDRGIEFILEHQHPDGLITMAYPSMPLLANNPTHTASYNHAISGLMLGEVYGMTNAQRNKRIKKALTSAIDYSLKRMPQPKRRREDQGGWRYPLHKPGGSPDSDLSVTSWQLMFLRSCRNAGFDIPTRYIDEALAYVHRCYNPKDHTFWYGLHGRERRTTRTIVGAGTLSLSLAGEHHTEQARRAGQWLLEHPFDRYNVPVFKHDRFFYGAFYCSQAMFQLGGRYWAAFYPVLFETLVTHQAPDGSWGPEGVHDKQYGKTYATAFAALALAPPYQLLPIFQR